MKKRRPRISRKRGVLVGVRVDGSVERGGDGHTRVSRGDDFVAVGGTREGHEHLRETVAEISDEVKRRGQAMADVRREELREILDKVQARVGPVPK